MLSLIRQKAGFASVTPLSALFTLLPFSIQQAFGRFLSSHVVSWQRIFSHPLHKTFANYMITYLQGFLDCDACPSTIDLTPWSHTFSLRCASAIPRSSTSKTLLKRCPSEKCFSYVPLSNLIRYPTKSRTYIHADTRSVSLSASLGYAKSLLLFHPFAPVRLLPMNYQVSRISDIQLPSSVSTLYIDGSFFSFSSYSISSMAYAWTAIDSDGFILDSHYNIIPSLFPSALRSEIFALLHGLDSLPRNSKITSSAWAITSQKNLEVTFIKVPAHADDSLNNHVDALAKAIHINSHLPSRPLSELLAPCILQFNSLPVDMNIRKFIKDIFDAKSLLSFAVLPRFNSISSTSDIDWACTKF
ncbi:hypothetical protein RhiirA1_475958, partial [Rhizophagus irregularis]